MCENQNSAVPTQEEIDRVEKYKREQLIKSLNENLEKQYDSQSSIVRYRGIDVVPEMGFSQKAFLMMILESLRVPAHLIGGEFSVKQEEKPKHLSACDAAAFHVEQARNILRGGRFNSDSSGHGRLAKSFQCLLDMIRSTTEIEFSLWH